MKSINNYKLNLCLTIVLVSVVVIVSIQQCCLANNLVAQEQQKDSNNHKLDESHGKFKLPKFVDFSEYKRIYRKHYGSIVQEMARMKLYLAGVMRVIISAIKYRFFGKPFYLAVNRMTDWTDDEWRRISIDVATLKGEDRVETNKAVDTAATDKKHFEAVDLNEIETKLPDMFAGNEAKFERFISEIDAGSKLGEPSASVGDDLSHKLSAEMLLRSPDAPASQARSSSKPASNNPNYVPPELSSMASAASDNSQEPALNADVATQINKESGLIDKILDGLTSLLDPKGTSDEKQIKFFSEGPDEIFIDHRKSGCLRAPIHQMECGSCYAIATLALYEWLYCTQQREKSPASSGIVEFSPQYVIDCGTRIDHLHGCNGGSPQKVAEFIGTYGIELESNYPYAANNQTCPYEAETDPKSMGFLKVDEPGLEIIKQNHIDEILATKPVLVNLYPNSELKSYGGGIYNNYQCEFKYAHAMLLVGSGRKDNVEYWIIRNSLGPEWGEQGYLYMDKGAALNCLVDDGTTTVARFPTTEENPNYGRIPKDAKKLNIPSI